MIIQCQSCAAKYFLPEEKVPVDPLKVRCPKCRAVFMLAGRRERVAVAAAAAAEPVAHAPARPAFGKSRSLEIDLPVREPAGKETAAPETELEPVVPAPTAAPAAEAPVAAETPVEAEVAVEAVAPVDAEGAEVPVAAPVEQPGDTTPAPAAPAARASRGGKSADDRAKRLARVLVSDILWYNRERRDAALRDGTLMTSLGEEIKKSWELYKEKVGPEAAHSTNYFKEALNEILADGQQVF